MPGSMKFRTLLSFRSRAKTWEKGTPFPHEKCEHELEPQEIFKSQRQLKERLRNRKILNGR